MADYYVSNSGSSGSGTIGSPWGLPDLYSTTTSTYTAGIALTTLTAGDTLYFRAGTYNLTSNMTIDNDVPLIAPTHSGTAGNSITLQSYPGESVTLNSPGGTHHNRVIGAIHSYVRILGFTINSQGLDTTAVSIAGVSAVSDCVGNEIGYCTITAVDLGAYTDNHQCIYLQFDDQTWIHHCNLSGSIGGSENSSGLKVYDTNNLVFEDNYVHGNTVGVFEKNANAGISNDIHRRNWITGNDQQWLGIAFTGLDVDTYHIYDNVIDGFIKLSAGDSVGAVSTLNIELYNNLFRTSDAGDFGIRGTCNSCDTSKLDNIWNNITIGSGGTIQAYQNREATAVFGGPTAQLAYMDYNVYNGVTVYSFAQYSLPLVNYTMLQFQSHGLETHSSESILVANIFVNQVDYVLKPPFDTAGRYGDMVGPRYPVAQILDTSNYGPGAMPGPPPPSVTFNASGMMMS